MQYEYGNWLIVIGMSVLFLFLICLVYKPKTSTDWRSFGAFSAFIVALFAEMYGFPLTIYLLSSWFGNKLPQLNFTHSGGHLWEVVLGNTNDPHFSLLHIASSLLIFGGLILITNAWKILYEASNKEKLAITGPYYYIRHPQYAGFILIIIGFLLQWPTIPTILMAPILIVMYLRLARKEEQVMSRTRPTYQTYAHRTPAFFPSLKKLLQKIYSQEPLALPYIINKSYNEVRNRGDHHDG